MLHADDPTWWGEHDAELLDGSCAAPVLRGYRLALNKLALWRDRLFELHTHLGGSLPAGHDADWVLSAPALRWGRSTVWSRAFNATLEGSKTVVLVPVSACLGLLAVHQFWAHLSCNVFGCWLQILDMLDHHPDSKVEWAIQDNQFQLTVSTRVQQVGTVLHSQGVHESCFSTCAHGKVQWYAGPGPVHRLRPQVK